MAEMVPLTEAALRMGISVDSVRKRIRRRTITAEKRGDRWFVEVPEEEGESETVQAPAYGTSRPSSMDADTMIRAIALMEQQLEKLANQLDVKDAQLAEASVERAELRRLLGNAQMQLDRSQPDRIAFLPAPSSSIPPDGDNDFQGALAREVEQRREAEAERDHLREQIAALSVRPPVTGHEETAPHREDRMQNGSTRSPNRFIRWLQEALGAPS